MLKYFTQGTCSSAINFEVKDNTITHVDFEGGCNGNLQGISKLVEGMQVDEVIKRLENIHCGRRLTSCPDQLACALKAYKQQEQSSVL